MSEHYLVRHGESQANAGLATADPATVELTRGGRLQAALVALALRSMNIQPGLFAVSSYTRAQDSALPAQYLYPEVPIETWPIHEFTYIASFTGITCTVADRKPVRDAYWNQLDPQLVHSPGSESYSQLVDRASGVFEQLRHTERTVVLFGHEQFFNMLLYLTRDGQSVVDSEHMKGFKTFLREHRLPNGSITVLDTEASQWNTLFVPPEEVYAAEVARSINPVVRYTVDFA
jgi:probable phosphoglycerate mutase